MDKAVFASDEDEGMVFIFYIPSLSGRSDTLQIDCSFRGTGIIIYLGLNATHGCTLLNCRNSMKKKSWLVVPVLVLVANMYRIVQQRHNIPLGK